jgi:hypothetical protein
LLAISVLPLSLIYTLRKGKFLTYIVILSILSVGIHNFFNRGYYRWGTKLLDNNVFYSSPRSNIFVDPVQYLSFKNIEKSLDRDNTIFVYDYSPLIYFLYNKNNPTRWDNLPPEIMEKKVQDRIIKQLEENNVKTIVASKLINIEVSLFSNYVKQNFKIVQTVSGYEIWRRK